MPTELLIPLVGMHFRPPAKTVVDHLPAGCPLGLVPEPENPYDPKAIKVLLTVTDLGEQVLSPSGELANALLGTGWDLEGLLAEGQIQLGYLADSDGKICRANGDPGNAQAAAMMAEGPVTATFAFLVRAAPGVKLIPRAEGQAEDA